jgi:hypothetical protein
LELTRVSGWHPASCPVSPHRTAMRKAAMPGEDEKTLKIPEDLSPHIVKLALPSWSEKGNILDLQQVG